MVYINVKGKKRYCVVCRNHSNLGVKVYTSTSVKVENYTSDESGLFHFVRKSLHEEIRAIGKYPMCKGFILVTHRLELCNRGTLSKGPLRMYPSLSVPTHPFRVLGLSARGKYLASTTVILPRDAIRRGVCSGNLPDFLVLGAI